MVLCQKAKIDNQGRIAIPKDMLTEAGLKAGDMLYVHVDEANHDLVITTGREGSLDCHWITGLI